MAHPMEMAATEATDMSLPIYQSDSTPFSLMQTAWASSLNPIISNPLSQGLFLKNVSLIVGETKINHLLGRTQQGYIITDQNGAASIYRSKPFGPQSLSLTSNAAVVVNIYVF